MNFSAPTRRIASHRLYTEQGFVENPLIELAADGEILHVGRCDEPDRVPRTEFYPGLLVPGLVNAHCHLELSFLAGRIPPGGGFASFARALRRERNAASEQERRQAAEAADARMWSEGTAAVGDVSNAED